MPPLRQVVGSRCDWRVKTIAVLHSMCRLHWLVDLHMNSSVAQFIHHSEDAITLANPRQTTLHCKRVVPMRSRRGPTRGRTYILDRSDDSVAATDALSTACQCAKDRLQARAATLVRTASPDVHASEHARELREADAYLFYFQDRGADAFRRNARRLCGALRLLCEYVLHSSYLHRLYSSDEATAVGRLHRLTAWAAHAPARHGGDFRIDDAYISSVAVALTEAVATLDAANVEVPRTDHLAEPLMWRYPAEHERLMLVAACVTLNVDCAAIRLEMDARWHREAPRTDAEVALWHARDHVFWFRGHAPTAAESMDELLDKARRLCLGLRLLAEDVGNILSRPAEATALWEATVWAAHPHNRRLGRDDRLTETVALDAAYWTHVVVLARALVEATAVSLRDASTCAARLHVGRGERNVRRLFRGRRP